MLCAIAAAGLGLALTPNAVVAPHHAVGAAPMRVTALSMRHTKDGWKEMTPFMDAASFVIGKLEALPQALGEVRTSDMLRFAQHQTKSLVAGGLSFERFIEDLFNEDTSNVPPDDQFDLGECFRPPAHVAQAQIAQA